MELFVRRCLRENVRCHSLIIYRWDSFGRVVFVCEREILTARGGKKGEHVHYALWRFGVSAIVHLYQSLSVFGLGIGNPASGEHVYLCVL